MELVRQTIINEWRSVIKRGILMFTIPMLDMFYFLLNNRTIKPVVIETFVDKRIPFNKYFVIPYMCWYLYVAFFLIYFCIIDAERYYKLMFCIDIGFAVSCIIFYIFPTFVPRPVVYESDIFSDLVRSIYKRDNPINCFPSIHVLFTLLVEMFVSQENVFKKLIKRISFLLAAAIILSTLFIKQHYFMDIVAAAALACILYFGVYSSHIKFRHKIFG